MSKTMSKKRIVLLGVLLSLIATSPLPAANLPQSTTTITEGDRLWQTGIEQLQSNHIDLAIASWKQALSFYQQLQDNEKIATVLINLGNLYLKQGEYNEAIQYFQPFLSLVQKLGQRTLESQALNQIGLAYQGLGDINQAIQYQEQNLKIVDELGNPSAKAATLGNLGVAYKSLGNYIKALDYYQEAIIVLQLTGNRQGESQALGNIGNVYEALGEYEIAIERYNQSLEIARAISDTRGEGIALGSLGAIYANQGNASKAINYYQQSLAIAEKNNDLISQANTLNNLGTAYHFQRDLEAAIKAYEQSLTIARTLNNRQIELASLSNLGIVYDSQDNPNKAIEYEKQSLAIAQSIKDVRNQGIALNNLGFIYFKMNNFDESERILRQAITIRESLRPELGDNAKISLSDTQFLTYNLLQKVLVAKNEPQRALEIAERGRARAFIELLASKSNTPAASPPNLEQIKQIAKSQKATIVEYSLVSEPSVFVGKLRGTVKELFIWVIQPNGEISFRRSNLTSLEAPLSEVVESLRVAISTGRGQAIPPTTNTAPDSRRNNRRLQQLHQVLIQPIADLLPKEASQRVIFIPHETLFSVPFPALQDSDGKYLIEKHTILTAPAIQVLQFTHKRRQATNSNLNLVVGNPTMPSIPTSQGVVPLQPLPNAEKEAIEIATLLNTKAITGDRATKAYILSQIPNATIIHLATHGLLEDLRAVGVPGAIALAPSENDDGFLTASEIINLKLQAQLVVLSACNTGRGTITGDGVVGLSRSFIAAGVESVIVSLWAVPDESTAKLMTQFYRNLQQNPDRAIALRQAMLKTMQDYPQPLEWAAFTLIGEAE